MWGGAWSECGAAPGVSLRSCRLRSARAGSAPLVAVPLREHMAAVHVAAPDTERREWPWLPRTPHTVEERPGSPVSGKFKTVLAKAVKGKRRGKPSAAGLSTGGLWCCSSLNNSAVNTNVGAFCTQRSIDFALCRELFGSTSFYFILPFPHCFLVLPWLWGLGALFPYFVSPEFLPLSC